MNASSKSFLAISSAIFVSSALCGSGHAADASEAARLEKLEQAE